MLEDDWVGRRVGVRRVVEREPGGRLVQGDVVGDLVGLDAQTAVVQTRAGHVEVPRALVTAAVLAHPSTADQLALTALAARSLRSAHVLEFDGWQLRADGGFTRRANSVLPLRQLRAPLADAVDAAARFYAEHGLQAQIQVPTEARRLLDAGLGELGWTAVEPSRLLAARLDLLRLPPDAATRTSVTQPTLSDEADAAWLRAYRDGAGGEPAAAALLNRHPRVTFASVHDGTRTVAVARGTVDDGWLGLTAMEVAPEHRRRGLARALTAALRGWAAEQGAQRCFLQVRAGDEAAIALYESMGFWTHHEYHYRIPGAAPDASVWA